MKLLHVTTHITLGGKEQPAVTLEYTDSPEVNKRVDEIYNNILQKYGYDKIIETEMAQRKLDPKYGLEIVYDIEENLYHHVKQEFMYNYGGLPRELNQHLDYMIEHNKIVSGVIQDPDNALYDARVELYTNIVVMFQEFGGIPKVSTN